MLPPQYKRQFYTTDVIGPEDIRNSVKNSINEGYKNDLFTMQSYDNEMLALASNEEKSIPLNLNMGSNMFNSTADFGFSSHSEDLDKKLILCPKSEQM